MCHIGRLHACGLFSITANIIRGDGFVVQRFMFASVNYGAPVHRSKSTCCSHMISPRVATRSIYGVGQNHCAGDIKLIFLTESFGT